MSKIISFICFFMLICSTIYADNNVVINNILNRKSVRKYTAQKVEQDKIDTIIKAGMSAPSAMNKQPWEFIVISDKKKLEDIAKILPYALPVKNASVAIIVCGNVDVSESYWVQDCSAVTENILLAAESLGLGAVWCGIYPQDERVKGIQRLLIIPKNIIPLSVVPIGYPLGNEMPKQKYNPSKIHNNKW
ncbi:MAG: nitroreductase family protein [Endomicrobiaceae bacterium]|nr:nitroreductase family protein [Endomicrobiaceae bacterium]